MSRKVQLLVGFLVFATILAGWQLLGTLHFPATLGGATSKLGAVIAGHNNDVDHDGLTNEEESYWNTDFQESDSDGDGYKDGEEVASGHDPAIPGPDDLLITDNMTQALDQLIVAGLYEGSLKPSNPNFVTSLEQIADAVVGLTNDAPLRKFNFVVVPLTQDSLNRYKAEITRNIASLISTITPTQGAESFEGAFRPTLLRIRSEIEALSSLPVPKSYETPHGEYLAVLTDLAEQYQGLIDAKEDPVQQAIIIGQLAHIFNERLPLVLERYKDLLRP